MGKELSNTSHGRSRAPDPGRFRVSKATLRLDSFMTRFIFFGGLSVIFAIFGIFFFILAEIIPLFKGAEVEAEREISTGVENVILAGMDEWAELPFVADASGNLTFIDTTGAGRSKTAEAELPEDVSITSSVYQQSLQSIAFGLSNGQYVLADIKYRPQFADDGSRTIAASVEWDKPQKLGDSDGSIIDLDVFLSETRKTIAGIVQSKDGSLEVSVVSLKQKRSLFGASGFKLDKKSSLAAEIPGTPVQILVGAGAESLVVRTAEDGIHYLKANGSQWELRQSFSPFQSSGARIRSMDYIQGKVSLSFTSKNGDHLIYSLYRSADTGERLYAQTKEFEPFPGGASEYAASMRNKAFLIGNNTRLSLRYSTTEEIRWEAELEQPLKHVLIGSKFDKIVGVDPQGTLHFYTLSDPHPEAGFKAFFGKIWYEGQDEPQYIWQSTGGTDDFEPKLSLIPLIVGSLKGTFYAMIFAIPIAILAAIYTSQFLNPGLKRVIKPSIEIMASLPSVVLGFLAALWLAPLIEDRVPSVLLIMSLIPLSAVLVGYVWNLFPIRIRVLIPMGWEFVIFVPLIVIVGVLAWHLGPLFESLAFRYTDPATGQTVGDFRLWWEAWTGNQFQQRNSLVVGFIMGFAVIPIIYTIAEDAISAVPPSLVSGSLALGASRWQTTARIILPTASAGIFSAFMIGLGRAVGETMIVVMATGNTPILDFDIFSGMRTLSANIAVELPEAPHGGTLYRTLFLGAFVLFILTFAVNTIAEIMRTRLRNRYKVIS
ncbi:ABC transporter permease subunit [Puniceicoccales bacterium CK1056]|uniref:ABC transporter permease subunit n=1 Tax=Oceanipulchritudo coccoides TaxID=2706888 RepID=A0A6B2LYB8_9BACT|nr:ABC transporter permease subunit [Oceanipulchritudo coccoides]NDV61353.1 ABC transporter permease subunit [Oceanipulchritudo coccoides]